MTTYLMTSLLHYNGDLSRNPQQYGYHRRDKLTKIIYIVMTRVQYSIFEDDIEIIFYFLIFKILRIII